MKKIISLLLTLAILLSLCACGAETAAPAESSAPEAAPTAEAPTEPTPEPVTELLVWEYYQLGIEEDSYYYGLYLNLDPISSRCTITTSKGRTSIITFSGSYTEVDGLLTVDNGSETLQLRRGEETLTLEKGSLTAYCGDVRTEEGTFTNYEGEPLTKEMGPGTVFQFPNTSYLRSGIYVMDPSEYEQDFDEVLINIDLTNMTFALKCYDGYVVTGTMEFEAGNYGSYLVCRYEDGALAFNINNQWVRNDDGTDTVVTILHSTSTDTIPKGQLMYCPPGGGNYLDKFILAPERTDEIEADPDVVPLDSLKQLAQESYYFQAKVPEDPDFSCYLTISHYPLSGKWLLSSKRGTRAEGTVNPDGTIVLTAEGSTWNFHWENDGLVFDGGDPLIARNAETAGPQYEISLEAGTFLRPTDFDYLYDTTYTIPTWNGGYESALRLDHENQRVVILCADGSLLEAPFVWEDSGICCATPGGTMRIYPRGHSLSVHVPWGMTIATSDSQSGSLTYTPTYSTPELEEALVFLTEVPEETPDPEGSILVYENNIAVSLYGYYLLTGDLTLHSHSGTFWFNTEYSSYYTKGTYTEENGLLTLRHSHGTTVLRREGNNLVVESGDLLSLAGQPFTLSEDYGCELPLGSHIPLYTRGLLHNGTYTFSGESGTASVTFDTENRTFTLTDAAGATYEGSFTLSEKFVNCDAGSKIFQFIPDGTQVRLNQRDIDPVVPDEEEFIFFDFAQ